MYMTSYLNDGAAVTPDPASATAASSAGTPVATVAPSETTIAPGEPNPTAPLPVESWAQRNWIGLALSAGILGFLAYKKWRY